MQDENLINTEKEPVEIVQNNQSKKPHIFFIIISVFIFLVFIAGGLFIYKKNTIPKIPQPPKEKVVQADRFTFSVPSNLSASFDHSYRANTRLDKIIFSTNENNNVAEITYHLESLLSSYDGLKEAYELSDKDTAKFFQFRSPEGKVWYYFDFTVYPSNDQGIPLETAYIKAEYQDENFIYVLNFNFKIKQFETFDSRNNFVRNILSQFNPIILEPPVAKLSESISFDKIYTPAQLKIFKDSGENFYRLISRVKFPPKKTNQAYIIDCKVSDTDFTLTPFLTDIGETKQVATTTLKNMLAGNYGLFPSSFEISEYEKSSGRTFKNKVTGINGARMIGNTLEINFFDSTQAYGGGSSRVACMSMATTATAMQFPTVHQVLMCIDKYPNPEKYNCAFDFQP